jgi:hypothetical protein
LLALVGAIGLGVGGGLIGIGGFWLRLTLALTLRVARLRLIAGLRLGLIAGLGLWLWL